MSSPESPDTKPEFIRRSESESICRYCSQTVRTDGYAPLEYVEDIHADVCLSRQNFSARYHGLP
jgi:hypothetical protein